MYNSMLILLNQGLSNCLCCITHLCWKKDPIRGKLNLSPHNSFALIGPILKKCARWENLRADTHRG